MNKNLNSIIFSTIAIMAIGLFIYSKFMKKDDGYVDKFNESSRSTLNVSEFFVGDTIKDNSQVFGTYYAEDNRDFYIIIGDMSKYMDLLQKNDEPEPNNIATLREDRNWNGFVFLSKGGNIYGTGFWEIVSSSPVIQKHSYPAVSKGKEFNGIEIYIEFVKDEMGYEYWPNGNYQIRMSPKGLDAMYEQLVFCGKDGFVKLFK